MAERNVRRKLSQAGADDDDAGAAATAPANVSNAAEGEARLLSGQMVRLASGRQGIIVGARIPKDYFMFSVSSA
jgi:hypothetical protein